MAVFENDTRVCGQVWNTEPTRAPEWVAELAQLLESRGLAVTSFDRFVCGLGPGSFSGIRAALSALQGMALAGGRPVYGVASAAALALGQARGSEHVTVIGDARRNRLWCVTYLVDAASGVVRLPDGHRPTHTAEDFLLVPSEDLAAAVPAGTRIVTSDWERLSTLLSDVFPAERLVSHAVYPLAEDVGRLAWAEPDACVFEPLPVYLHPAVAERAG